MRPCAASPFYLHGHVEVSCRSSGIIDSFFMASCDWGPYIGCEDFKQQLAICPLFDALAHRDLLSAPGLVFMKENKGFTGPEIDSVWGEPFQQGVGRCLLEENAECQTGPPPQGGNRQLAEGEGWCDTSINGNGRVLYSKGGLRCDDPSLIPDTTSPCDDAGKAWGVCNPGRPRLPSRGFEYDVEELEGILPMAPDAMFETFPGCGTLPLIVRSNRAGGYGGGLFQVCVNIHGHMQECMHACTYGRSKRASQHLSKRTHFAVKIHPYAV